VSRWPMVAIGEVADSVDRSEAPLPGVAYRQVGVHLWGEGAYERESMDGADTKYKTLNCVKAGDIIVNKIWARNGSVSVVTPSLEGCFCSGEFPLFRPRPERLDPQWFYWITKTRWFWEACDRQSRGTSGKNRLRPQRFLEITIPLAPIEEQRRVVEKLNRLAVLQDRAKRASLSNSAAIGLLPTSLRSVRFAALAARLQPVPLGSIGDVRLGKMLSGNRTDAEAGIPYLRNANVQWDFLDLTSVYRMQLPKEQVATYSLKPGDVLVCEGGDIGKSAIWSGEIDSCLFQKALHRIRLDQSLVDPRFLLHHIMWCAESGQFADVKTQTTIAHLTGVQLKAHPLFLPSLHEQQKMVHDLDKVTGLVDRARRNATAASEATEALKRSALAGVLGH